MDLFSMKYHFYAIWKEKEKSLIKLGQGEGKVKLAEKQVGKDKYPLLTDILVMFFWEPMLPIWQFPLFDICYCCFTAFWSFKLTSYGYLTYCNISLDYYAKVT